MSDAPTPSAGGSVNKAELATILNCSLPTLDKLIRKHGAAFPVMREGSNGRSYAFDPAAVTAFLQQLESARIAEGRAKDALMQQYTLPEVVPADEPALKPQERLALARVRQIERDELIQSGFLIKASDARAAVTTVITALRRDMNAAVRQALRAANVPEAVTRNVEGRIAEAQRNFVRSTQEALRKPGKGASSGAQRALF